MKTTHHNRPLLAALLLTTLLLAAAGPSEGLQAQQRRMAMPDTTTFDVTAEGGVPEIPFELINNHLVLPVSINGSEPLRIVLDTGMPAPGLALFGGARTENLGLDVDPTIRAQVRGAGGQGSHQTARIAMSESLALPGLEIDGARIILMPPHEGFGTYHDGVMGYSLFERFVVELDYDRGLVRLLDPASYEPAEGSEILPLTFRHRIPYATVRITPYGGEPFGAEVVVDLGASHAISLNTDESEAIAIPDETLTTILGRGLSGPVEGELGRIAVLELGGAALHDVVATFPISEHQNPRGVDSLAGNLGSDVLRRFHTTFDYAGSRMVLRPNGSFRERFRFDRSGLRLRPDTGLVVERVIAGSPAEEAGIEVGDVVTHIDSQPVSGADYGDVIQQLRGAGRLRLSLRRGSESFDKTLSLRRLI